MEIMSLNVWGGRKMPELLKFLANNSDVDVFCFQEVISCPFLMGKKDLSKEELKYTLFSQIALVLPEYSGFFSIKADLAEKKSSELWFESNITESPISIGNAIFVKKKLFVETVGDIFVYGNRNSKDLRFTDLSPKTLQYVVIIEGNKRFNIFNFHGIWNGGGKKDTPDRIGQSMRITKFINKFSSKKILCGDFNLDPETESISIIEDNCKMINLIKENKVLSTRTRLYRNYDTGSRFADYFFVSPDVVVNSFHVNYETLAEVSDHAPLLLNCD